MLKVDKTGEESWGDANGGLSKMHLKIRRLNSIEVKAKSTRTNSWNRLDLLRGRVQEAGED